MSSQNIVEDKEGQRYKHQQQKKGVDDGNSNNDDNGNGKDGESI